MKGRSAQQSAVRIREWLAAVMAAVLLAITAPVTAAEGNKDVQETNIAVSGMLCSSCASAVEQALKKVDGVTEAKADANTDLVRVRYDGKKVTPRQMAETIRKAGYQARWPGE
jgi:copper chaperone CopZ